jgi:hypothetical protein
MTVKYSPPQLTECISTHGGAGYAPGTHWTEDGLTLICGLCGRVIDSPTPTGYDDKGRPVYGPAGIQQSWRSSIEGDDLADDDHDQLIQKISKPWENLKNACEGAVESIWRFIGQVIKIPGVEEDDDESPD